MFRTLLISMFLTSTALATTWTVDDDGKADFDNIQAAVDAASDGDEIIVYPGTYTGTGDEVVKIVKLGGSVTLRSTDPNDPNVVAATIIDGQNSRTGITCDNTSLAIKGFTITNGYSSMGGGMYNVYSSPTLTNCTFIGNTATGTGGGMYNRYCDNPTLTNCTFTGNTASTGGGMHNYFSSPTLTECTFIGNTANTKGGGMYANYPAFGFTPTLTDCTFENNTAEDGGGMHSGGGSPSPRLTNCTFTGNTADLGGGMWTGSNTPLLTNCILTGNSATGYGGGIYNYSIYARLADTTVCGNTPDQIYGTFIDNGGNSILDLCLIGDKDNDGVDDSIDNCDLYNPDQLDCNGNEVGDVCDIADGKSNDTNGNGIPDECDDADGDGVIDMFDNCYLYNPDQADCNENDIGDICDIADGKSNDINGNGIPDECEDTDDDGVPDDIDNCDLYNPDQLDCNGNEVGDVCDVADSTSLDCDQNGVPDECQPDCDGDGWIDACDNDPDNDGDGIPDNCEPDCNGNGIPDHFEIELGLAEDCNGNGIPDECDFADGTVEDCNWNGIPDDCELADNDCNGNGIPDSCDIAVALQEINKLHASDGEEDEYFGYSVSIDSDFAIVGAPDDNDNGQNSGSAYIFKWDGSNWIEQTKLLASDGEVGDSFGKNVSISGNVAIIGAYGDDDNGDNSGSAYIYRFDGTDWIEEAKLLASDGSSDHSFGISVSISGNTAITGAVRDDDNGSSSGAAYVYRFNGKGWIEEAKILASDGEKSDYFGESVSIDNDIVVIGAKEDDDNGSKSGSAYIYRFDGSSWIEETKLLASDGESDDWFGTSVSIDGDTVIVGAKYDDDNGPYSGSAYIFRNYGNAWNEEAKVLASDGLNSDYFGESVSISGSMAIVGTSRHEHTFGNDKGAAYIYRFDGTTWIEETELLASDGESNDEFGWSVSISGGTAIVGAFRDNDNTFQSGSAYIFGTSTVNDCNSNGIPDDCDLEDPANDQNNNGELDDCECIGDTNSDGIVDVDDLLILIGSWGNDTPWADLNFDGIVDVDDLLILISNWGPCE